MPFPNEASNYYNYPNQQQHQYMAQYQQQLSRDDSLFKLKHLDEINVAIIKVSQSLIQFFDELTKDKLPPAKLKQAKTLFDDAIKHLKNVEKELIAEISHLNVASTGHPHEGSIYGARKDYDLTKMQLNLIGSQLSSLKDALNSPLKNEFYESDIEENADEDEEKPQAVTEQHANTNGNIVENGTTDTKMNI